MPVGYAQSDVTFRGIPAELEDAGRILGAGRLRILRDITAPLARSGVIAAWCFIFIGVIRELSASIILFTPSTKGHGHLRPDRRPPGRPGGPGRDGGGALSPAPDPLRRRVHRHLVDAVAVAPDTIASGGLRLRVASAGLQSGTCVAVSIRPHQIEVVERSPAAAGSGANAHEGTVRRASFLGDSVDYEVQVSDSAVVLRVAAPSARRLRPGRPSASGSTRPPASRWPTRPTRHDSVASVPSSPARGPGGGC
jgi:hypothetical protein